MNEDADLAAEAFRAGASAYLLKRSAASELLTAIREVMQGRSYITPLVTEGLVGSLLQRRRAQAGHELTPRQREVLQLLAEGRSMKEVASVLNLTPRTVAFHKYRMMEQLKVKSTAELDSVCRQAPHRLNRPRVLLVDDNEAMLARAAAVLTPGCVVVGAVTRRPAALERPGRCSRTSSCSTSRCRG